MRIATNTARIPCRVIRGGSSKGVFFHEADLPEEPAARDRAILAAFGSPDRRQIDGIGGADPLTSKVALLGPSRRRGVDVDYVCGQVGLGAARIDYSLNCGNLAAGAALFAVQEGLVRFRRPLATVRIFNPPTGSLCVASVHTAPDDVGWTGGSPPTGMAVDLRFPDAAGATTGELLPTGAPFDVVDLQDGTTLAVSIVDAGNLYAFAAAADFGLHGGEDPGALEQNHALRTRASEVLGVCSARVRERGPGRSRIAVQRLALVAPARDTDGSTDLVGRIFTAQGRVHKAFAVTGAIATAFGATVERSVVRGVLRGEPTGMVRIGHPEGVMFVGLERGEPDGRRPPWVAVLRRTARCLLDGWVHLPHPVPLRASAPPPIPLHLGVPSRSLSKGALRP